MKAEGRCGAAYQVMPSDGCVAALEAETVRLKKRLNRGSMWHGPWWEEIAGGFANDPIFEQAMKRGQRYRRSLRRKPSGPRRRRNGRPR